MASRQDTGDELPEGAAHTAESDAPAPEAPLPEPTEEDARGLAEALGRTLDECLAALIECGGDAGEAAGRLLEQRDPASGSSASAAAARGSGEAAPRPSGDRAATVSATMAEVMASEADAADGGAGDAQATQAEQAAQAVQAARIAEVTHRTLDECRAALHSHSANADAAVAYLLSLPPADAAPDGGADPPAAAAGSATSSWDSAAALLLPRSNAAASDTPQSPAAEAAEDAAVAPCEAVRAARLTEVTGKPFQECLKALRACEGRADDAVASLLGLAAEEAAGAGPGEADDGASAEPEPAETEPPASPEPLGIMETMAASPFQDEAGDTFAGVAATHIDEEFLAHQARPARRGEAGAELEAAEEEAPPAKRRRSEGSARRETSSDDEAA